MKIDLDPQAAFELAEEFARGIHSLVVSQHLRLIGTRDREFLDCDQSQMQKIRAALRSVDAADRRGFIGHIRWHFKKIRAEAGTEIRGRDYVAKVEACRAERIAA